MNQKEIKIEEIVDVVKYDDFSFKIKTAQKKYKMHSNQEKDIKMWMTAFSVHFEARARISQNLITLADINSYFGY